MSKRKAVSLVLLAVLVFLAVWFSTLSPEAREAVMGLVVGR